MAKQTQNYRLYQLLKASDIITKETIAEKLGVDINSVPVYIHELKRLSKAEVETIKDGRKVIAYKLLTKDLNVPELRRGAAVPFDKSKTQTGIKTAPTILDEDIDLYDEKEFNDIRSSLGIDLNDIT